VLSQRIVQPLCSIDAVGPIIRAWLRFRSGHVPSGHTDDFFPRGARVRCSKCGTDNTTREALQSVPEAAQARVSEVWSSECA
jgi:hypothetical protein